MKKILRIIAIFFATIISIVAISLIYFFISNQSFLEAENDISISYLQNNSVPINQTINEKLFDSTFYKSQVFLLGEIHGFADNQKLDKELLFFLNKKLGIKYYLAEMDSITAKKLNTFLAADVKNEKLLKEVIIEIQQRIPQQASQELFEKWKLIYDYNKKLAAVDKITVIGIDKNVADTSSISRDEAMVTNFQHALKLRKIQNEKFYGFFGFFHSLQNKTKDRNEIFAYRLKKAGVKVTTMVSYTLDSEMYLPKMGSYPAPANEKVNWFNADGPMQLVKGINDLKAVSKPNAITLFKINATNSPYLKSQNLIAVKSRLFGENIEAEQNSFTTDYFQYVFILRNSKALTKLK